MTESRGGSCRIQQALFVALLGVAVDAGGVSSASTAAKETPAAGVNLIANPDFDKGVAGWTSDAFAESDADAKRRGLSAFAKWVRDRDFAARSDSGALELAVTAAGGNCVTVKQCVVAHPGTYELAAMVFFHPTGALTHGAGVQLEVYWGASADCSTHSTRFTRWLGDPTTAGSGKWTPIVDPTTFRMDVDPFKPSLYGGETGRTGLIAVPEGTWAALLRLNVCTSGYSKSTETVIADFDHLMLRPVQAGKPVESSRHP